MSDRTPDQPATTPRLPKAAIVGVGIGSAAIVAALLYAGKLKGQKRPRGE